MRPSALPALALALALTLSGCGFGRASCDPASFVPHCTDHSFVTCVEERAYGFDFGASYVELECGPRDVCIDSGNGAGACVLAPATRCEVETFTPRCSGGMQVICTSPSSFITDSYEYETKIACSGP